MIRPFTLSSSLPFQCSLLLQNAFPLPVLLCEGMACAINIALDLHTAILTTPRPRCL